MDGAIKSTIVSIRRKWKRTGKGRRKIHSPDIVGIHS